MSLPACDVNHVYQIDPVDLELSKLEGGTAVVRCPSAHIGQQPLQLRVMSHCYRRGQVRITVIMNRLRTGDRCVVCH